MLRSLPLGHGVATVLSLALGIGAGTAAFGVIDAVRLRSLPFPDGDRLVVISEIPAAGAAEGTEPCPGGCDVGYELFANLLRRHPFRSVDQVAGYTSGGKALTVGGEPILLSGGVVSPNLFGLLGAKPMLGRLLTEQDDRLGVGLATVISHEMWTNYLGRRPDIVGQTVKLSDSRYTVVGVMPPGFDHETGNRFWLPAVPTLDPSTRLSIRSLTAIARLTPGTTVDQFSAELASIDPALLTREAGGAVVTSRFVAVPLRQRYAASTRSHDLIFAAIVAGLILIAAANVANLVLVRSLAQRRVFAIRAALGADVRRIVAGVWGEQAVLVGLAALLGLGIAAGLLGVLRDVAVLQSIRPAGMEYRLDLRAASFAVALAAGLVLVLSAVPVRLARRTDVQGVLREGGPRTGGAGWLGAQRAFVVAQLAIAVVLLTAAGLLAKTVSRLGRLDLGFEPAKLIEGTPSFPHPWRVEEKYLPVTRQIVAELGLLPGVARVAVRAEAPLAPRGAPVTITLDGQANPLPGSVVPRTGFAIDTAYLGTLGIPVVRGRGFGPIDGPQSPPVVLVNVWAAARWWPGQDPVGRTIRIDSAPGLPAAYTVVGVVADNRAAQPGLLLAQPGAELYRPLEQAPSAFPTFLVATSGGTAPLVKPVRETLARLVPDRPLFAGPVTDRIDRQLAGVRTNEYQILGFAGIGLLLAVIGVYGVLAFAVGQRTQEIGIRGALGARRGDLIRLVLVDACRLVGLAILIGVPLAVLAARGMAGLLHGTDPADPAVIAGVGLGLAAIALVAAWIPARRAASVDPLVALQ
ncbi:MAG: FtsX-like permease family protein [Gemmatimonadetes bacterium]|nr:FtsX-like permease family protein [Gemmatimonadota bacterium]